MFGITYSVIRTWAIDAFACFDPLKAYSVGSSDPTPLAQRHALWLVVAMFDPVPYRWVYRLRESVLIKKLTSLGVVRMVFARLAIVIRLCVATSDATCQNSVDVFCRTPSDQSMRRSLAS